MKTLHTKYLAILLPMILLALLALAPAVRALNVDATGSITLTLPQVEPGDEEGAAKREAIEETDFTGRLYRVAKVDASYNYTPVAGFDSLATYNVQNFKSLTAEEIRTLTEKAAELAANTELAATAKAVTFNSGEAMATGLDTGLYLLVIDEFTTENGVWRVTSEPALLPVPVVTGETTSGWDGSDNYDVAATVKLNIEPALTKIRITKQLPEYSALQGPASFVFRVDAVNDKSETVFSNVYAMTFTDAGSQELVIDNIPVNSQVTVTEVYSGTSYTPDGSGEVQLTAQPMAKNEDGTETLPEGNTAAFVNRNNNRRSYGTAVTNAFSYVEGRWQLTQNFSDK